MNMTFRWYGTGNDTITLPYLQQVPGIEGLVWALHLKKAGELWTEKEVESAVTEIRSAGFNADVVESVNVSEEIKLGKKERDEHIENYIKTLENLGKNGVKVVCYNFMPVFDWLRTDLFHPMPNGATALFYSSEEMRTTTPEKLLKNVMDNKGKFTMAGWEPERLGQLEQTLGEYAALTEENVWENYAYFLKAVIPAAKAAGIKMAVHPDDPPWSIFGLPRIVSSPENFRRLLKIVDDEHNGLAFCCGALAPAYGAQMPQLVDEFIDRIPFIHIRNVKVWENGDFIETSHKASDGVVDIPQVVKVLYDKGFKGYARPDHGRHIWDEQCRPGYGLYDRALGAMYIQGLWDGLELKK